MPPVRDLEQWTSRGSSGGRSGISRKHRAERGIIQHRQSRPAATGVGSGQRSCRASRIGRHIAGRPVGHSSLRSWPLDEFGTACSATDSVRVLDTRTCSRRHGRKQALNTSRGAPPHLAYALKLNSKTGILDQAAPKRLAGKDNWPMSSKTGQADPIAPPERTTLPNSQPILGRAVLDPWLRDARTKQSLPAAAR